MRCICVRVPLRSEISYSSILCGQYVLGDAFNRGFRLNRPFRDKRVFELDDGAQAEDVGFKPFKELRRMLTPVR